MSKFTGNSPQLEKSRKKQSVTYICKSTYMHSYATVSYTHLDVYKRQVV